jgi:hypothetical protein
MGRMLRPVLPHDPIRHWESEVVGSNPYHLHLHGKHVRPAYDGLTIEWREWGTGEHGHSAHEDRIVREYRPQHATWSARHKQGGHVSRASVDGTGCCQQLPIPSAGCLHEDRIVREYRPQHATH